MSNPVPSDRTAAGRLVGRQRELSEMRSVLSVPSAGRGRLLLLRGEGGIGKTRLAEELCREARGAGHRIYWGSCIELAGAPAFWPWVQVLRQIAADRDHLAGVPRIEQAGITRLLPELHWETLDPAAASPPAAGSQELQGEHERFQFFDGITGFLRRVAQAEACGIVLDDLHAADPQSLLLLEFVARQLPTLPLWIVATYREVETQADPQRRERIAAVERQGRAIQLQGLSPAEVAQLVAQTADEPATPAVLQQIYELTAGNPFFVDELARLLWPGAGVQAAPSRREAVPIPSGVREVVRQSIRRLGDDCRNLLDMAAVLGREFDLSLLQAATGIDGARLLDLVAEGEAAQVVLPRAAGSYAFRHALLRETIYEDLVPSQRVDLHRRAASAIETIYAGRLDDHLAAMAFHYARVAPLADAAKAYGYARRAAQRALAALAYEDAARLFEMALDALPASAQPDSAEVLELLLALGNAYVRSGDTPHARAAFERAASAARRRKDPEGLALAAIGYGGLGLGVPTGTVDRLLVDLLEEALAYPREAYPLPLRARLLARHGLELYFANTEPRRRQLLDEAERCVAGGDLASRIDVSHARMVGLWDLASPSERMAGCTELIALAAEAGDDDTAARGHMYRLLERINAGDVAAWQDEEAAIDRLVERLREPRYLGMACGLRAMRALWQGRLADTESLGQQAMEFAQSVNDLQIPITIAAQRFVLRRLQGASEEVEASARVTAAAAPSIPGTRCMLALALCDLGRFDEARAELAVLDDENFSALRAVNRIFPLIPWLAETVALLGDRARMLSLKRDLEAQSGRTISLHGRVCFGPADYFLGLIQMSLGDLRAARTSFEASARLAAEMGGQPSQAAALAELAAAECRLGNLARARDSIAKARDLASALGLVKLVARVEVISQEIALAGSAARAESVAESAAEIPERIAVGAGAKVVPLRRGLSTSPPTEVVAAGRDRRTATLRRDGNLWTVAFGGTVLRCKASKGLQYLAVLLGQPGKPLHVLELAALDSGAGDESASEVTRPGMRVGAPQLGEPVVDAKALAAYRNRLAELNEDLEEAEKFNDLSRATGLREEAEALTQALAGAIGFGRRMRTTGSFAERARLNVTRAIRSAIERIGEGQPELRRHLTDTIRTGALCGYYPKGGERIAWEL